MISAIRSISPARASATVLLALGLSTSVLAANYTITDLGASLEGTSVALGLNNRGDVVLIGNNYSSYIYSSSTGTMTRIDADQAVWVSRISNNGNVAGTTGPSLYVSGGDPFLYANGTMTSANSGTSQSFGRGVNDAGQVVGAGWYDTGNYNFIYRGFVSQNGVSTPLPTLGGRSSEAWAINDKGQIAGSAWDSNNKAHLARFDNGTVLDLGRCQSICNSLDINESGQIAGYVDFKLDPNSSDYVSHAFLYDGVAVRDLGTLGGTQSGGFGINEQGDVVGQSSLAGMTTNIQRAFIYSKGTMTDLNLLIDPSLGWTLTMARGINDSGQIVGTGTIGGVEHAFLLTPTAVPVPATAWMFGSGLLGLWGAARRRHR